MKKYLFILVAILSAIILTSCRKTKKENVENAVIEQIKVSEDVKDAAEINTGANIRLSLSENTEAKVLEINGDKAIIEITAPDMKALLQNVLSSDAVFENNAEELARIEEYVKDKLDKGEFTLITKKVTVDILKDKGNVTIVENDDYYDALLGGMLSYYDEIMEEQNIK